MFTQELSCRCAHHLYVRSITSRIPVVGDYSNVAYPLVMFFLMELKHGFYSILLLRERFISVCGPICSILVSSYFHAVNLVVYNSVTVYLPS